MSRIGRNIKKIRVVKKMSQAAFAELFNLARPSIGAYEEERAEPKIDTIIQIANYFGLSIDLLLTKELTINDLYKFDVSAKALAEKARKIKSVPAPDLSAFYTVLVSVEKQLDYIVQHQNRDFIAALPKIYLPEFNGKQFRSFEMNSDEMHDNYRGINRGDLVVAKRVDVGQINYDLQDKIFVVVTAGEILIRRLSRSKDVFHLKADHPGLSERMLEEKDILETWQAVGYFTTNLTAPSPLYDKMLMMEQQMDSLHERLKRIEKNK